MESDLYLNIIIRALLDIKEYVKHAKLFASTDSKEDFHDAIEFIFSPKCEVYSVFANLDYDLVTNSALRLLRRCDNAKARCDKETGDISCLCRSLFGKSCGEL